MFQLNRKKNNRIRKSKRDMKMEWGSQGDHNPVKQNPEILFVCRSKRAILKFLSVRALLISHILRVFYSLWALGTLINIYLLNVCSKWK